MLDQTIAGGARRFDQCLSGGAPGADALFEEWAVSKGIQVVQFKPNWDRYGRRAGALRTIQLIEEMGRLSENAVCVCLAGCERPKHRARTGELVPGMTAAGTSITVGMLWSKGYWIRFVWSKTLATPPGMKQIEGKAEICMPYFFE